MEEYLFGPPSELLNIGEFLENALRELGAEVCDNIPEEGDESECSVQDIHDSLRDVWDDPVLAAYLSRDHMHDISAIQGVSKPPKAKQKRAPAGALEVPPPAAGLKESLENIKINAWSERIRLHGDSILFARTSKFTDQNALSQTKHAAGLHSQISKPEAIITTTMYNRTSWNASYLTRLCQNVFHSAQTLGDILDVVPCAYPERQRYAAGETPGMRGEDDGAVMCIENMLYGDKHSDSDYADKLCLHLQRKSKDPVVLKKAETGIYDTPLSALAVRVNQPYWLLHRGNCEHFIVINQIRLQHPDDVNTGYPLTTQVTPALLDLCRACSKVPATLSVVNDVRFGESPCLLCARCWDHMGPGGTEVIVVPLPLPE